MPRKKLLIEQIRDGFIKDAGLDIRKKPDLEKLIALVKRVIEKASSADKGLAATYSITLGLFKSLKDYPESAVYHIADRFGQHLHKTKLDVQSSFLPQTFRPALIELPESVKFNISYEGEVVRVLGASVYIAPEEKHKTLCTRLWFLDKNLELKDRLIQLALEDSESIENILRTTSVYTPNSAELAFLKDVGAEQKYLHSINAADIECVLFFTKVIVYLGSAEPDIKPLPSVEPLTKKSKKIRKHWDEHYLFDVVTVGYGFHGKTYTVDETTVSGHFRWQRCGPEMSQIKLIWIDEHLRKYS